MSYVAQSKDLDYTVESALVTFSKDFNNEEFISTNNLVLISQSDLRAKFRKL